MRMLTKLALSILAPWGSIPSSISSLPGITLPSDDMAWHTWREDESVYCIFKTIQEERASSWLDTYVKLTNLASEVSFSIVKSDCNELARYYNNLAYTAYKARKERATTKKYLEDAKAKATSDIHKLFIAHNLMILGRFPHVAN